MKRIEPMKSKSNGKRRQSKRNKPIDKRDRRRQRELKHRY